MDSVKFSSCATSNPPDILEGLEPEAFLTKKYNSKFSFGLNNLHKSGVYKENGWAFNFRPYLKRYVFKQYDQWHEIFAPNKTALRASICGKILKIVEL